MPIRPVDLGMLTQDVSSLYEAVSIISRRARQVNDELKDDLRRRLETVITTNDDDAEITNYDQLEISREFDKIPKPSFLAIDEMLDQELIYTYKEKMKEIE